MKKAIAIVSMVLLAVALCSTVCISVFMQRGRWENAEDRSVFKPGIDFSMRMNEADCLADGVDPYDVWNRDVIKAPYYPLRGDELKDAAHYAPINVYTPWEYPLMMPLLLLPRQIAWGLFYLTMLGCIVLLGCFAFGKGMMQIGDAWSGLIVAAMPLLIVTHPLFTNLSVGNWTVHIALAVVGMIYFLNRGHDVLAGICWSFAMIKPQLALLLAIPLLWRRKWVACVTAGVICAAASIPACILSGKTPVTLVIEVLAGGSGEFYGCGIMPYPLFRLMPMGLASVVCLVIGIAVCIFMTYCLRKCADWLYFLMPATVCAVCWTYAQQYSYVFNWFILVVFLIELLRHPESRFVWLATPILFLMGSRSYRCLYGLATVYNVKTLAFFRHSEELRRMIDSFNSSLTLVVAIAFCIWIARQDSKKREVQHGK